MKEASKDRLTTASTEGESTTSLDLDSNESKQDPKEDMIRQKLSMRAYHLPGNSWSRDLRMYIVNNHLVFGLCCHHRLHPVKLKQRFVMLLGSLAFGLSATNAVYLYYLWGKNDANYNDTALSISFGGDVVENVATKALKVDITHGMALLWTVGAASHSFFDLSLWHMIACGCTKGKCKVVGWNLAVAVVMLLVAATSFIAVVRAYESTEEEEQQNIFDIALKFGDGKADFQYLYGYMIELLLSLFVYTPLAQLTLFTGILGCGALPFLGGRLYEVRRGKTHECTSGEEVDV
ncbi:hypothetical protein ACHAWF_002467 [Thalassiosira exigua]